MTDFFSPEHEAKLLALFMRDEDYVFDAMGNITPGVFNSTLNSAICDNIFQVARKGMTPTPQIVADYIESKNNWEKVSGKKYFKSIADTEVDAAGFEIYYNHVLDAYKRRELAMLSQKIPLAVHNNTDISDFIAGLQSHLSGLNGANLHGGIRPIEDLLISAWDIIKARRENPNTLVGATTGFGTIDENTGGYIEGDVWIYSGRPSQGKTTALIQSFKDAAKAGNACLLFNREMSSMELMFRFLAMDESVPHSRIKTGKISDNEFKRLKTARNRLSKLPIYLDSSYYGDINYVTSAVRKHHKLHDIRLVGIDYVQLLAERSGDQVAELGRISRELKLLAMDLGITIVILSQLNRKVEDREDRRPILSDLRQSGNLEEDADVVIGLYRDDYYNMNSPLAGKVEFIILKQRNGPTGRFTLDFHGKYLQILDDPEFGWGSDDDEK
jgi:replicative DNA helicase